MLYMAVVAPSTNVILCQNVPLDKTYKDTLTFANRQAQYNYFYSKRAFSALNCQFVKTEGAIRFPEQAEQIDTCNYLMFQNEGFGSKWYYAFIDRVEYAQTGMSRIWFTLDVMQTWAFDYTVHPSMVVREHVSDDSIGANTVPEGLGYGPYKYSEFKDVTSSSADINESAVVLGVTTDAVRESSTMYSNVYNGVLQAVRYTSFDAGEYGAEGIADILSRYNEAGKSSAVVAMYLVPKKALKNPPPSGARSEYLEPQSEIPKWSISSVPSYSSNIDGYTPRNNKLYTYPYYFLYLTNRNGSAQEYRYELFDGNPQFLDMYTFVGTPEHRFSPINYGKPAVSNIYGGNDDFGITSSGSPVCAWSFDAYTNYMQTNLHSIALSKLQTQVVNPMLTTLNIPNMSKNPATMLQGQFDSIESKAQWAAKENDMRAIPPSLQGSMASPSIGYVVYSLNIYYSNVTITAEYARLIDDYFTAYGYQVNRLKVPNINTRPSWNYVQTSKAMITGSIPFGDLAIIRDNFNRGITFWHGDWVGDYTRNNGEQGYTPPVGPVDPDPPVDPDKISWGVPFSDWEAHVTSEYGWRTNPITGEGQQFHSGIDIAYPTGTQIMAIANGTVTLETSSSGRGMYMDVKVDEEYTYRYQHLSAYDVPVNAAVRKGEFIAKVGATGDVTGPHLHLEILKNGQTVDPRPYLEGAYNG